MLMNDTNAMNSSMSSLEEEGPLGGRRGKMRIPWVSGMRPGYGYDYGARAALSCPFISTNINWPAASTVIDESDLLIERIESVEDLQEKLMIKKDVEGSYALFSGGISGQFVRTVSINNYSLYFLVKAYAIASEQFINASATRVFRPEARQMSRSQFQNSFGDYFVEGRVRGSAFLALLEIKTQSEQVKMQVLEELNFGKVGGKSSPTFAATFGAQFQKAATHQGVSFALYVSEHGVGPDVINLANNIAPEYAANMEYLRVLEEREDSAYRELNNAKKSLKLWTLVASLERSEADKISTELEKAKPAETKAQTAYDEGKVEESPEYKALAPARAELEPLEQKYKEALREYELAGEKLKKAEKRVSDLRQEVDNSGENDDALNQAMIDAVDALDRVTTEVKNTFQPKENAEKEFKTAKEKYSQELEAFEGSTFGKLQKALEAAKELVIRLQKKFDDADAAATLAEGNRDALDSNMETLETNYKNAQTASQKGLTEPPPESEGSPHPGTIRYRTLDAYDKCIETLIQAATRTKEQALKNGKDLYAIICPYSILPNAPGVGRGFNIDRLDLIYERLDRAWRNAKLILNSVNYALEMGNKSQFAESREELVKIQEAMERILNDIHLIDRNLRRDPEASIGNIPNPPNLSQLPRRLWSTVKEKIAPPKRFIPQEPLTSMSAAWNIAKNLNLPREYESLKSACKSYCQQVNEGIHKTYTDIIGFIDDFNLAWQEIRVVDPNVGDAKVNLQRALSEALTAQSNQSAAETALVSAKNAESRKGTPDAEIEQAPTVIAALAAVAQASTDLTKATLEVNTAQKNLADLQSQAHNEKLSICENLTSDLGQKKVSLDTFILTSQSAYTRLIAQLGDQSIPKDVRDALAGFKKHCESDLHKLLWDGVGADGVANDLHATETLLFRLLEQFSEKLKVLPADEPPAQYIEMDTRTWSKYRGDFSKAASNWTKLL